MDLHLQAEQARKVKWGSGGLHCSKNHNPLHSWTQSETIHTSRKSSCYQHLWCKIHYQSETQIWWERFYENGSCKSITKVTSCEGSESKVNSPCTILEIQPDFSLICQAIFFPRAPPSEEGLNRASLLPQYFFWKVWRLAMIMLFCLFISWVIWILTLFFSFWKTLFYWISTWRVYILNRDSLFILLTEK